MKSNLRHFMCGGAIGLVGALPLVSQDLSEIQSLPSGQGAVSDVALRNGALRGIGPSYRAAFDAHGLEFTPALGIDAPRTMPWRFEVVSVARGATTLWSADGAARGLPSVGADGSVCLPHGDHIVETFELREDGVKQSFVFDSWGERGDLVVRGRVHSELQPLSQGDLEEVSYDFGNFGGVHLGKVLGIDGASRTGAGSYRVDGDMLEMVLPENFVADAQAPLVLDPLVGPRRSGPGNSSPDRAPQISFESRGGLYLAVWERAFSIGDVEIIGAYRDANAQGIALGAFSIASGGLNRNPDVSRLSRFGRFMVAYEHSDSFLAPRSIRAKPVGGTDGTVGLEVELSSDGDNIHPTLAGSGDTAVPVGLVAWEQRGAGIKVRQISFTGQSLAPGTVRTVESNGNFRRPAFSRSSSRFHALAYEEYRPSGDRSRLWVRRIGLDANDSGIRVALGPNGTDNTAPAIDGDDLHFRLAYVQEVLGSGDPQIRELQIEWNANNSLVTTPSNAVVADTAAAETEPTICLLGPLYLVAWSVNTNTNNREVHAMTRGLDACGPCGREYVVSSPRGSESTPAVCGRYAGIRSLSDAAIAWSGFDSTFPFNAQLYFHKFEAFGGNSLTAVGSACGGAPNIRQLGTYAIGSPDFGLEVNAGSIAVLQSILLISVDGAALPQCGSCVMLETPIAFPVGVNSSGVGTVGIPVPCDPSLDGGQLWFQFANLGAAVGGCPLVPPLSLSQIMTGSLRD